MDNRAFDLSVALQSIPALLSYLDVTLINLHLQRLLLPITVLTRYADSIYSSVPLC